MKRSFFADHHDDAEEFFQDKRQGRQQGRRLGQASRADA
jgi:hypothetical protein